MSGYGYHNAAVEAFFKTIIFIECQHSTAAQRKAELIWRRPWQTRRQAGMAIFEYINGFYNPRRFRTKGRLNELPEPDECGNGPDSRLISADATTVAVRLQDYRSKIGDRQNVMRLSTSEFIRRFLTHVLPLSQRHKHRLPDNGWLPSHLPLWPACQCAPQDQHSQDPLLARARNDQTG